MVIELCEFLPVPVMWLHRSQHSYRQAIPRRDWFSWQEVMSFTGSSLYRLPVGAVPVKKPLQWLPVISPVDPGTSTRGLSTGGTVGVPSCSSHVPVKLSRTPPPPPLQWFQWSALFWYWNLHQRPFYWWDCWGYRFRSVQTTGGCCSCEETPSVVASDHPFLILEPPPEAFPLVGLLGYRFQSCSCEVVKEPPFSGFQWSALCWYWNLHQRPFHCCDCWGYRFQSCSDHRCSCSEGSPTRSRGDHWDPYLPSADFWTGTSPVQATGRVTSQPVLRDTGTSSAQTAGCGHKNPARATGFTGLPVTQSCWWWNTAGALVTENCQFRNRSDAGYRLLVTEKSAVPIITGKAPAANPVLTTGSPVTKVSRLQRIEGDKLVGQEVSSVKSFNQPVTEPTIRVLVYTTFRDSCFTRSRDTGEVLRYCAGSVLSQNFWLQRDTSLLVWPVTELVGCREKLLNHHSGQEEGSLIWVYPC